MPETRKDASMLKDIIKGDKWGLSTKLEKTSRLLLSLQNTFNRLQKEIEDARVSDLDGAFNSLDLRLENHEKIFGSGTRDYDNPHALAIQDIDDLLDQILTPSQKESLIGGGTNILHTHLISNIIDDIDILLTPEEKDELTDGGVTELHSHPGSGGSAIYSDNFDDESSFDDDNCENVRVIDGKLKIAESTSDECPDDGTTNDLQYRSFGESFQTLGSAIIEKVTLKYAKRGDVEASDTIRVALFQLTDDHSLNTNTPTDYQDFTGADIPTDYAQVEFEVSLDIPSSGWWGIFIYNNTADRDFYVRHRHTTWHYSWYYSADTPETYSMPSTGGTYWQNYMKIDIVASGGYTSGIYQSISLEDYSTPTAKATLLAQEGDLDKGSISYYLSNDDGATWGSIINGGTIVFDNKDLSGLKIKIEFTANDSSNTPYVDSISITTYDEAQVKHLPIFLAGELSNSSNDPIYWYAHFTSDGIGVEDLEDVRIYIKRNDEDSYAVEGELCSSKGDGIYIFKQENPTIGKYWAVFKTAGTSVDQKEMATTEDIEQGSGAKGDGFYFGESGTGFHIGEAVTINKVTIQSGNLIGTTDAIFKLWAGTNTGTVRLPAGLAFYEDTSISLGVDVGAYLSLQVLDPSSNPKASNVMFVIQYVL